MTGAALRLGPGRRKGVAFGVPPGDRAMFAMRVYVVVAFAIALVAFAIGQVWSGARIIFAAIASTGWTVYSVTRGPSGG